MRALSFAFLLALAPMAAHSRELNPGNSAARDDFWSQFKNMETGPLKFDFGGQTRLRYEYDDGFSIKGYQPGSHDPLLLERVRLNFSAQYLEAPRLFLQLQDAHAFLTRLRDSDFPQSSPLEDTLDIRQLYVEWLHVGESPLGFRVGRQEISYGDQRVFGPGNWGNTGRFAWDAAMLKYDVDWSATDLWVGKYLTYKNNVWPDSAVNNFLTFVGYTQIKKLPFRLDLFYVLKSDTSGTTAGESGKGDLLSHTVGMQAGGTALGILDWEATYATQFGQYGRDTINAFGASGKFGITAPLAWKPRIGVQYTLGSGDSNPTDGVHGTFDGVFGGRDIYFYGYTNLFFWANLHDAEIDISLKPRPSMVINIEYHRFNLDQATDSWYTTALSSYRRDPTGRSGTDLGGELDFRVTWTLWDHLELMAGYGGFIPGSFVSNTGPASPANWYFGQSAFSW